MIALDLTRWARVRHSDGSVMLTARPTHPAFARNRHAKLRIRHDVRPLATFDAVCAGLRAGLDGPRDVRIERSDPSERLVTRAGEYAAFRHLHVTAGNEALSWGVGVIAGNDRMTVIDGLAQSPNIAALVRDVLDDSVCADASERIRMVPYRPPVGWFGVRRPMATCWLAPRAHAAIVVGDAVPRGPAERMHGLLWPLAAPERATRGELDGAAAPGTLATWTVEGCLWAVVELADARWSVRIALQAGDDQHVVELRDLVRSIELPPPPAGATGSGLDWMVL